MAVLVERLRSCCLGDPFCCNICCEDYASSRMSRARMRCCGGTLCWTCLHAHVSSVVGDTQRMALRCPMCAEDMTDVGVRVALFRGNACGVWFRAHRRDVVRWERWSVRVGLATRSDATLDDVVACPALDCGNLWLVPAELRRRKASNEPEHSVSFGRLFYRAVTTAGGDDARRGFCDRCRVAYCLLCRRRWRQPKRGYRPTSIEASFEGRSRRRPPTESHDGVSCVVFAQKWSLRGDDDFESVAQAAGAKACPGCSLRVARTLGCNHMKCPNCNVDWCFVCETAWDSNRHYACRDAVGDAYKRTDDDGEKCALM